MGFYTRDRYHGQRVDGIVDFRAVCSSADYLHRTVRVHTRMEKGNTRVETAGAEKRGRRNPSTIRGGIIAYGMRIKIETANAIPSVEG